MKNLIFLICISLSSGCTTVHKVATTEPTGEIDLFIAPEKQILEIAGEVISKGFSKCEILKAGKGKTGFQWRYRSSLNYSDFVFLIHKTKASSSINPANKKVGYFYTIRTNGPMRGVKKKFIIPLMKDLKTTFIRNGLNFVQISDIRKSPKGLFNSGLEFYGTYRIQSAQPLIKKIELTREKTHKLNYGQGQRFAVVIGISTYEDTKIPSLRYASSDAKAIYNWLVSKDGGQYAPSRVKLLTNENANLSNIKSALFIWLGRTLSEDIVTIYFAGHGSPQSPDRPDNLYLLPYDTEYESIASTAFPMWDIETALKRHINAKKVIVIADACHSGGVGQSFDIARRANRAIRNNIGEGLAALTAIGDGVCVISAADDKQLSQESDKWGGGYGVFTWYLLKGLKGEADWNNDSKISLGEIIPYISQQVRRETRSAQSPTVSGKYDPALCIGQ